MCTLNQHDNVKSFNVSNGKKIDVCLSCGITICDAYISKSNGRSFDPIESGTALQSHGILMRFNGVNQYSQQVAR